MLLYCQSDNKGEVYMASKLPHYALRIPSDTMDKLKYIADRNGRSANKEIERLILRHIAAWEKANGTILFDDGFVPRSRSRSKEDE